MVKELSRWLAWRRLGGRSDLAAIALGVLGENGKVSGVECQEIDGLQFDENGRASFTVINGSEHTLAADTVIFAVGQRPDVTGLTSDIKTGPMGTIAADAETMTREFLQVQGTQMGLHPSFVGAYQLGVNFPDTPEAAGQWALEVGGSFAASYGIPLTSPTDPKGFVLARSGAAMAQAGHRKR